MAIKHEKVVTHRDRFPSINSHNLLNMFSREVTWQVKNIISPPKKMLGIIHRVLTHKFACPLNEVVKWGYVTSSIHYLTSKLSKILTVRYRYWEALIHKVIWPTDHVIKVRSCDNFKNSYFTITRVMASKPGRVLSYVSRYSTKVLKAPLTSCLFLFSQRRYVN